MSPARLRALTQDQVDKYEEGNPVEMSPARLRALTLHKYPSYA